MYPNNIQRLISADSMLQLQFKKPAKLLTEKLFNLFRFEKQRFTQEQIMKALSYMHEHHADYELSVMKLIVYEDFKTMSSVDYTIYAWYPYQKGYLVRDFIGSKAQGEGDRHTLTPEHTLLHHSLRHPDDRHRPIAWLSLDDPPFFFTVYEELHKKFITIMADPETGGLL